MRALVRRRFQWEFGDAEKRARSKIGLILSTERASPRGQSVNSSHHHRQLTEW